MFSVVITTKNRLDYLKRCVASVLGSTLKPSEIIIVNDAGAPFSEELFGQTDTDINIFTNGFSRGANFSRNLGIEKSKNNIVFLIDDDDAVTSHSFQKRIDILLKDENIGICFTGVNIVESNNLSRKLREVLPCESDDYLHDLFDKGNIIGSTSRVAIRKCYFNRAGGFDEQLECLQDYDLWIRMAMECKISNDGEANLLYTVHANGGQISTKYKKYLKAGSYLVDKYYFQLKKFGLTRNFESQIYLRVALSAASSSCFYRMKYSAVSFIKKPNLKSIALVVIPYFLLKRIYTFA